MKQSILDSEIEITLRNPKINSTGEREYIPFPAKMTLRNAILHDQLQIKEALIKIVELLESN